MSKNINRRQNLTAATLFFAALIGLGAVHSQGIRNPDEDTINGLYQPKDTANQNSITHDTGTSIKTFYSVAIDNNNNKWFITEQGIVSFDGKKWTLHNKNGNVPAQDLKDFAYEVNPDGQKLWIASPKGAIVASLPLEGGTVATTYGTENTPIMDNNVIKVAIGKSHLRWFGSAKGVSALKDDQWLKANYVDIYPQELFQDYPITAMAANVEGDSLYVGTKGAGIARLQRNNADGITGASVYAQWGPILLPSDSVFSIFIASDHTKWFGTDQGIARHTGNLTLKNWKVFTTKDGLADNFVQAIAADLTGKIWIGTKKGISVFDGTSWTSFMMDDRKGSNNIRCIAVDKTGVIWFGTDNGVISYENGDFTGYR